MIETEHLAWSRSIQVKARPVLSHVLGSAPRRVVIVDIADLTCELQIGVVVLHKVVCNPLQTVQGVVCLSSSSVALQSWSWLSQRDRFAQAGTTVSA